MKRITVIALIVLVILLSGCQQKKTEGTIVAENKIDSNAFDYSKEVSAKQQNTVRYGNGSASMIPPARDDVELFRGSSVVIRGQVIRTDYILKGSSVYTKVEVKVIHCYKGNLETGDIIKIRQMGGFIPSEIYDNALSMDKFGKPAESSANQVIYDIRVEGFKVMEQGEEVILFLLPIERTDLDVFKDGGYQLLRGWQGELLFHEDAGVYAPYLPAGELEFVKARTYTLEEFEAFAAAQGQS